MSIIFSLLPFTREIESSILDWRYRTTHLIGKSLELSEKIILVTLDEKTIAELEVISPFPRDYLAELVSVINDLGAKTVAIDIILDRPTNPRADSLFAAVINETDDILLPGIIEYINGQPVLKGPAEVLKPKYWEPNYINFPVATFQKQFQISKIIANDTVFSYPIVLCAKFLNKTPEELCLENDYLTEELAYINYTGPAEVVVGFPAFLLLNSKKPPREFFNDKIVLIGADFKDARDFNFLTPFSRDLFLNRITYMSGPKISLNIINTILQNAHLNQVPLIVSLGLTFICSILSLLIFRKLRVFYGVLTFFLATGTIGLFGLYLFAYHHIVCNMTFLLLGFFSGIVTIVIYRFLNTHIWATKDKNTGLFNRRYLEEYLCQKHLEALKKGFSLIIIFFDIDYFKNINDSYGHDIGDIVLSKVGNILRNNVKKSGIAGRFGGDELVVVLSRSTIEKAFKIAETIREEVKALEIYSKKTKIRQISISSGISGGVILPEIASELIKQADIAMYDAKERGRDMNIVFEQTLINTED